MAGSSGSGEQGEDITRSVVRGKYSVSRSIVSCNTYYIFSFSFSFFYFIFPFFLFPFSST